jgi:hypothetical protein
MGNIGHAAWDDVAVTNEQRSVGVDGPHTPGEKMMATYLAERDLSYEYELFDEGANPDFVAHHPTVGRIVLEVYEPEYRLPRNPDGSFWSGSVRSPGHVIQRGINTNRKHRQAKAARERGFPFVLVIASTKSEIAFSEYDVPGALFGAPEFVWSDDSDRASNDPGKLVFGAAGRLQRKLNTSFSAVALITPIAEKDHAHRLDIFHNPFAALLVRPEFAGSYDDQWTSVDDGQSYQKIVRGAPCCNAIGGINQRADGPAPGVS